MVGHIAPEAAHGGPIAVVEEGDIIEIDVRERELRLVLSDDEIEKRLANWSAPPPRYRTGVFAKYAATVSSAEHGAVTTPKPS
jgi:dihydroxy-acid dehydratase